MAGLRGKVNISGLDKFKKQMERLDERQCGQFTEEAVKELAARLLAKVKYRTPVGKAPTALSEYREATRTVTRKRGDRKYQFLTAQAAQKQAEMGTKRFEQLSDMKNIWSGYVGGSLRRAWTVGEVVKVGDKYTIEVYNPEDYAEYVEFGHRQTPGRFVPAIGKRLKKSWVEGKFMLTISEAELQADAPRLLMNKLNAFVKGAME